MIARFLGSTFTAGLLVTTMAFSAMTPTPAAARMSEEEIAALLGFLALGVVIHNSRDNDRTPDPVQTRPSRDDRPNRHDRDNHNDRGRGDWRALPAQCLTTVEARRGHSVRMYGQRCLTNSYRFTNRLPQHCNIALRGQRGGHRRGFDAHCLRNAGFRTN